MSDVVITFSNGEKRYVDISPYLDANEIRRAWEEEYAIPAVEYDIKLNNLSEGLFIGVDYHYAERGISIKGKDWEELNGINCRLHKGFNICVCTGEEIEKIESVIFRGETVLDRYCGDLINFKKLQIWIDRYSDKCIDAPMLVNIGILIDKIERDIYQGLSQEYEPSKDSIKQEVCNRIGITENIYIQAKESLE